MQIRKFLSMTAILFVLTAVCLSTTAVAADVIGVGMVDCSSLRMRSEASTNASVVTCLSDKTQVNVYEDLGDWYKISWGKYSGFVSADYLIYTPVAATVPITTAQTTSDNPVLDDPVVVGTVGIIIGDGVNLRTSPSINATVITKLSRDTQVTVIEMDEKGWCLAFLEGMIGYIKTDYVAVNGISLKDPAGVITGEGVNLCSKPSTESAIVAKLSANAKVSLKALNDGWYSVVYNGMSGYVSADYIRLGSLPAASSIGTSIVEIAKKYLGTPYVYGGASASGFDCSGFTMYIFGLHGYSFAHSATSQWNSSSGVYIDKSNLQPGDLVFFNDPARNAGKACSHVGIYIGDNQFIHSGSDRSGGVIISSLSESYFAKYYKGAKRIG